MGKEIKGSAGFHVKFIFFLVSITWCLFALENKSWQFSSVGSSADKSSVN